MNTYPYIGKGIKSGSTALIYEQSKCIAIESKTWAVADFELCDDINESYFTNITTEYLSNTYGEVKSEGHANFLVALAKNNGLRVYEASYPIKRDYFTFSKYGKLFFFSKESQMDFKSRKQITIPLPPESNVNTPEEDFEMKQIEKNNGDNLIFGGDDKCKEWPCVGDEVETSDGNGVVKLLPDSKGYYVISIKDEYYQYQIDELSKPKTPEEELRDELAEYFCTVGYDNEKYITALLKKYNITKKPQ